MMYRDLFGGIKNAYQRVVDNTPQWLKDAATKYADINKQYSQDRKKREEALQDLKKETATNAAEGALDKYKAPQIVRDFTVNLIDETDKAARKADSFKDAFSLGAVAGVKSAASAVGQAAKRGLLEVADKVSGLPQFQKPQSIPNYSKPTTNISTQTLPYTGGTVKAQNLPFAGKAPRMQNLPAKTTPYKFKYADILKYLRR